MRDTTVIYNDYKVANRVSMPYSFIKRSFDIISASAGLILFSPIFILLAIGLRLTGEGFVWFRQERVGYKNRVFHIYKFATMLTDSHRMAGGIITLRKDPRLTPLGGFLRATKMNELPQMWNILNGDMSVVGPRPVMQKSFEVYPDHVKKVIYNVKPGLTGVGSIIFRDEEHLLTEIKNKGGDAWDFYKNHIYPFKGEVEQWYQTHRGLRVDFLIVFITAWVILFPKSEIIYLVFRDLPRRPF